MRLRLVRDDKGGFYTAGRLYLGETYLCDTLEPRWRDILGQIGDVERKVSGETCIPEGEYEIVVTPSKRYTEKLRRAKSHPLSFTGGYMPLLLHVPFFSGILIHTGNSTRDTQGCILVGRRGADGTLLGGSSTAAFKVVYNVIVGATDKVTIEIQSDWIEQ